MSNGNYTLKEGQGSLFRNQFKDINNPDDRSPHFKGRVLIGGQLKEVAGWWAFPQNGGDAYMQLKVSEPRKRQQQEQQGYPQPPAQPQKQQAQQTAGENEDMPDWLR